MINGALHLGYSLARWTNSEVIMLPKDTDNIQINRRRVINKYEADFNSVLSMFGLMQLQEKQIKKEY